MPISLLWCLGPPADQAQESLRSPARIDILLLMVPQRTPDQQVWSHWGATRKHTTEPGSKWSHAASFGRGEGQQVWPPRRP